MSYLLNAVNDTVNRVGKAGTGSHIGSQVHYGQSGTMQKLGKNISSNFNDGAQKCNVVGEFRDIGDGILNGDFKKLTLNAAIATPFIMPLAGAASSSGLKAGFSLVTKSSVVAGTAALSTVHSTT